MLAADGVTMRSLHDAGEGEVAEDLRVIKALFSRREQRSRARRTRKGVRDKAKRGEVVGSAPQPRYGFSWAHDEEGRRVGYEVDPATMENVRLILSMLAEGETVSAVQREFEEGGVPAPGGGPRWSATTIRGIVNGDVYRPHALPELAGPLAPDVLARLDPEREYGIAWSGQRRTSFKPGRGKRRVAEWTSREKWIGVPVDLTGSGLERSVVDWARAAIEGNRRPAKLDGYHYELSGGILRCGACGRAMQAYRRKTAAGGYNHYYRCRPSSSLTLCDNRRSHRA